MGHFMKKEIFLIRLENAKFVSPAQVSRYLGIARATLLKWEENGDFPQSVSLGNRRLYKSKEVKNWIAQIE